MNKVFVLTQIQMAEIAAFVTGDLSFTPSQMVSMIEKIIESQGIELHDVEKKYIPNLRSKFYIR